MSNLDPPLDCTYLENQLAVRRQPLPSAGLRSRVLAAVYQELRRGRCLSGWRLATSTAAAVLIWVNLSMCVTISDPWQAPAEIDGAKLQATAARIQDLFPELPEHEVRRQALLMLAER
jgi:hypothetical protein